MENTSPLPSDDTIYAYTHQTAQLLGLHIPPEIWPSVEANFAQIAAIAQPVLEFELPDELEPGPTFDP